MTDLFHLVEKLNDFGGLNMSLGSKDRNKVIKIIERFCQNNNLNYDYNWGNNKFVINNKFYLYQNSLKWFELKEIK